MTVYVLVRQSQNANQDRQTATVRGRALCELMILLQTGESTAGIQAYCYLGGPRKKLPYSFED